VRGECLVLLTLKNSAGLFPDLIDNSPYQCGCENVGPVEMCPKRRRIKDGTERTEAE